MGFFSEYKTISELLKERHDIVFYSESRHYYQYFEQLISGLAKKIAKPIVYITSDKNDPLLITAPKQVRVVYVKWMIGHLFSKLKARVMVMTMPDLDNYLFKKSKEVGHYVYVFHAAVSTHQQYRKKAFYHYDSILTVGPYQDNELKMAELLYHTAPKQLIKYGYPLFDTIKAKSRLATERKVKQILIAPSWFEGCIFDCCLEDLIKQLSKLPYQVLVRSHPEYEKRKKRQFGKISRLIQEASNVSIDKEPEVVNSLIGSDILITDRSGIAFEFALGTGRPVLFVETALKEVNHDWKELNIEPIENSLRSELGLSIEPTGMDKLSTKLSELEKLVPQFEITANKILEKNFYNSPGNYEGAVDFILQKLG